MDEAERLFGILAHDFALFDPAQRGLIQCPLCLVEMNRDDLKVSGETRVITVEHIVPRSLGGKITTLTCKKCNNGLGSSLDAHLERMVRNSEALAGTGVQLKGSVSAVGMSFPMKIAWSLNSDQKPGATIRIPGGRPADIQALAKAIRDGQLSKVDLSMTLQYSEDKYRLSLLKCAYLSLFRQFGYRYALSSAGQFARDIILQRLPPPIALSSIVGSVQVSNLRSPHLEPRVGAVLVSELSSMEGIPVIYLIIVVLGFCKKRYFVALLPTPHVRADLLAEALSHAAAWMQGRPLNINAMQLGSSAHKVDAFRP